MITFFRRLRRKFLSNNTSSKYVVYASGEILLVVIGILIALGINNLNEERKDKSKSRAYLERMTEELSELEMTLKEDAKRALEVQTYLVSSMEILKTSSPSNEQIDTLEFVFTNYNQFVRIPQTLTSFEEMKSNGDLSLIYSQDLRKSIGTYLRFLRSISNIYDQIANEFVQLEVIKKYVTYHLTKDAGDPNASFDFNEMAQDQYLINTLSGFARNWQTKNAFSERLANMSTALKNKLVTEHESY